MRVICKRSALRAFVGIDSAAALAALIYATLFTSIIREIVAHPMGVLTVSIPGQGSSVAYGWAFVGLASGVIVMSSLIVGYIACVGYERATSRTYFGWIAIGVICACGYAAMVFGHFYVAAHPQSPYLI